MSPVYVNGVEQGGGLVYTEIAPVIFQPATGGGAWMDWNLSASLPADAKFAEIVCMNREVGYFSIGARKDGSALARTAQIESQSQITVTVELVATRIIEVYRDVNVKVYQCWGYWK